MDWFPILSQTKSLVQVIAGDVEGAQKTQEAFSRSCPLIAQSRSLVEFCLGYSEEALQTLLDSCCTLSQIINSVPVMGHLKGLLHYTCDDAQGGQRALKAATRTLGVVGVASTGLLVLGPGGGIAGGACGGLLMVVLMTGGSFVEGNPEPSGFIALLLKADSMKGCEKVGPMFELCAVPALDALVGFGTASQTFGAGSAHTIDLAVPSSQPVTGGMSHSHAAIPDLVTSISSLCSISDDEEKATFQAVPISKRDSGTLLQNSTRKTCSDTCVPNAAVRRKLNLVAKGGDLARNTEKSQDLENCKNQVIEVTIVEEQGAILGLP